MGMQLELELWKKLARAEAEPEHADVKQLCLCLDLMLDQGSLQDQLARAGAALFQLAAVVALRAELMFKDWRQAYQEEGPTLEVDELEGLIRQSMVVGLEDLITEPEPVTRRSCPQEEDTVAVLVEKAVLLNVLEAQQQVTGLEVVEEEAVTDWVAAIAQVIEGEGRALSFEQVLQRVGLSEGKVFLGLLLGEFDLRPQGERFYSCRLMIQSHRS